MRSNLKKGLATLSASPSLLLMRFSIAAWQRSHERCRSAGPTAACGGRPSAAAPRHPKIAGQGLLAVTLCLAMLAALAWYLPHRNAATARSAAGPNGFGRGGGRATATVALAEAKLTDIPVRLEALGTVTPLAVATVHPQVAGVVSEISIKKGRRSPAASRWRKSTLALSKLRSTKSMASSRATRRSSPAPRSRWNAIAPCSPSA